ncbi:MAG TPA: hypothetical protein VF607_11445 [Verrucomicrobiae bacterium]
MYPGKPLADSQRGLLKVQKQYSFDGALVVLQINQQSLLLRDDEDWTGGCEFELLPGHYQLIVNYIANNAHATTPWVISFDLAAGKVYDLRAAPKLISLGQSILLPFAGGARPVHLWIEAEGSHEIIAGDPRTEPKRWYE